MPHTSRAHLLAPIFSRLVVSRALASATAFPCRAKRPCLLLLLFSCVLGMLLVTHPVQAQTQPPQGVDAGSVINIVVTPIPTKVTVPINTASTFKATATAGTQKYNPGWGFKSGPTYQWFVDPSVTAAVTISPTNAATVTVSVPAFTAAGTNPVKINCTVTYQAISADGPEGTITGSGSTTVPVYVIGGPITGDTDEYFYCQVTLNSVASLNVVTTQPAGTAYAWSISGPAVYCDGYGVANTPTGPTAQYRGALPGSTHVGDVTANVTYSLNGVSVKSSPDWKITTHLPATFVIAPNGLTGPTKLLPPDPNNYGFDYQQLHFQVLDGVGQPVQKGFWDETWAPSKDTTGGGIPDQIGAALDLEGKGFDYFHRYLSPAPTDPLGDLLLSNLIHTYFVIDKADTGGDTGCKVKVYTGVNYYTYRLAGNGFPQ